MLYESERRRMKFFKKYTFDWWQFGIFKLALFAIGAAAGAYWHEFFMVNMTVVLIIAVLATLYSVMSVLNQ